MADIESALVSLLKADSTVASLVSTRIYPVVVPQGATLPAIAQSKVSGPRVHAHDGVQQLATPTIQWECKGSTYASAKAVATAVRGAVDGYTGTIGGVTIQAIYVRNEIDGFSLGEAEASSINTVYVDAIVHHKET